MFGKLLNLTVGVPLRAAVAPMKVLEDVMDGAMDGAPLRAAKRATAGTARYVVTGRTGHRGSFDRFLDFDDDFEDE